MNTNLNPNPVTTSRSQVKTSTLLFISTIIFVAMLTVIYCLSQGCSKTDTVTLPPDQAATQPVDPARVPDVNPVRKVEFNAVPGVLGPYDAVIAKNGDFSADIPTQLCVSGILIDVTNKKVLWQKNADKAVPIASMTKMMTTLLVCEGIEKSPFMTFETPVKVSKGATVISTISAGGSRAWLDARETFTVDELFQAMIVHSSNDCAELLGETFAPDSSAKTFVAQMNARAKELGMNNTTFYSTSGLPPGNKFWWQGDNMSTARDMAMLGAYLTQYPRVMKYSSQVTLVFRPKGANDVVDGRVRRHGNSVYVGTDETIFSNSNRILLNQTYGPGIDGLKTGFTQKAKYCVTASCLRDGRRMIAVVTGVEHGHSSNDQRAKLVRKLFDWGYAQR